ncbi:hypothetical protein BWQ92_01000 [Arthrobacter sp. QXT-31]|nr:hypothetical protein BWQ92_01000 [Arthrobacter sp. QXT-31]
MNTAVKRAWNGITILAVASGRPPGLPEAVVPGIGAVAGIFLATIFSMVIGELVPKNFALLPGQYI